MALESDFRSNDDKEAYLSVFLSPAKAGLQFRMAKRKGFQTMMSRR
jgi:hypothetical protein